MSERQEQPHGAVPQRREAEPFVKTFRTFVCSVHDQGMHGDGLTGGRDAPDSVGKQQASQTVSVNGGIDSQPADQGAGHRMTGQFSGKRLGQRGQIDRQSAQRVEAEYGIGVSGGADEHPRDLPPNVLAGLARQVAIQFGQAAGEGCPVVPPVERLDNQRA